MHKTKPGFTDLHRYMYRYCLKTDVYANNVFDADYLFV